MSSFKRNFELCPRLKLGVGRGHSQNHILKISAIICLTLALILSFNAARLIFSNKSQNGSQGNNTPQVLGATDIKVSTASQENIQFVEYKVQKGDTLFNLSQKFNISWTTIATLNNLKSPFVLKPGQVIRIPK